MDPYDFVPDLAPDIANLAAMLPVVIAEGLRKSPAPLGPERSADESFVRAAR